MNCCGLGKEAVTRWRNVCLSWVRENLIRVGSSIVLNDPDSYLIGTPFHPDDDNFSVLVGSATAWKRRRKGEILDCVGRTRPISGCRDNAKHWHDVIPVVDRCHGSEVVIGRGRSEFILYVCMVFDLVYGKM